MKRKLLLLLFVVLTATGFTQTSNRTITKEMFTSNGASLPYQLMKPSDASPTKKLPLVIYLHGTGGRGNDNESQVHPIVGNFLKGFTGDYSSIVIAPQCPKNDFWSNALSEINNKYYISFGKEEATTAMKTLMALVNSWIASDLVDKDRVYVGGISMGGFGTYELLWRMPSRTFAAAFPICGASDTRIEKLKSYAPHTPVWLFHGNKDNVVHVNYSREVYTALQQIKGSVVKYTEYANVWHDSWNNAFAEKSLIPWIFGYQNVEVGCYKIASLIGKTALTKTTTGISASDFEASNAQHSWLITKATAYSYKIQPSNGANYFLSANGTGLALSTTATTKNQSWKLVQAKDGTYNIISDANGYCLELTNNAFTLKAKNDSPNQKFKIALARMFLVGGATPGVWNIGNAQEMQAVQGKDAVFTWSGVLWANNFKFQSTKMATWESSYTALSANKVPIMGESQKLVVHPQSQYDFKFKLNNAGLYKLTVDMNTTNRNVTVSQVIPETLYMVGPAATGVWNANVAETMTPEAGKPGVFRWEGLMNAGEFKFILNKGSWVPSVNPITYTNVSSGNKYNIAITNSVQGDYKFKVNKSMYYTVVVDTENMTTTVTEKKIGIPLYLVGAAVPNAGWNNTKGLPMTNLSDSIYTWIGDLKAGQFVFITKLGTWNSIKPATTANEYIISEYTHSIMPNPQGDPRFVITDNGNYTIKVNLASNTMVVKKNTANIPLYLVGAAVPNVGWNNTKGLPMTKVSDGIYTWTGDLRADQFKFITKAGTWYSIFPKRAANESIINGFVHDITNYYVGDYKFVISEAGKYTITVNLINRTMVVNKTPVNSPIYLVGAAVPNVGWNNTRALIMNPISSDVYEWTGNLYKEQFKFITRLGTWNSIVPNKLGHEQIIIGNTHQFSNNYQGDCRYIMPQAGNYIITLNTRERTLRVEKATELRNLNVDEADLTENKFTIIPLSGSVKVVNNNSTTVNRARLLNLNGRVLDTIENMQQTFYLGNAMPQGIYIVEISCKEEIITQKIIIK